jgi:hypothetical protein
MCFVWHSAQLSSVWHFMQRGSVKLTATFEWTARKPVGCGILIPWQLSQNDWMWQVTHRLPGRMAWVPWTAMKFGP